MNTGAGIAVLLAALLAPRQADPPADPVRVAELALRVTADAHSIEFGRAFALTVVRVWSEDLEPEPWDDAVLAPLVVDLVSATQRTADRRVEETRRYRGYAFTTGNVVVPAPWFRARPRDGGTPRVAFADDLEFEVATSLPAAVVAPIAPEAIELPRDPFAAPARPLRWIGLGALALGAAVGVVSFSRRRRRGPTPPPPPQRIALERLAALRAHRPQGFVALRAETVAVSGAVRDYVAARFALRAPQMTTEDFLAAAANSGVMAAGPRERLAAFLAACDRVKFARHAPSDAEHRDHIDTAEAFVRETTEVAP